MKATIAVILIMITYGCSRTLDNQAVNTGKEGEPMPEFGIQLNGTNNYFNTALLNKNHPAVILYLSPICPYCRVEIRRIINNIEELKEVQFVFITGGNLKDADQLDKEFNIKHFKNIKFGADTGYTFAKYFKIVTVPFTAVYNNNQTLNQAFSGTMTAEQLILLTTKNKT